MVKSKNLPLLVVLTIFVIINVKPAAAQTLNEPNCLVFETGFQVCGQFLKYWQANGGLERQGLPISAEFYEKQLPPPFGDGNYHKTQYFQRARFELHYKQNIPRTTNLDREEVVLLGLLGVEQVKTRYPADLPKAHSAFEAANCQNFNETGFQICGRFLEYWRTNGGLNQFGFPLSPIIQEQNALPPAGDGEVHSVQYFQRARFEYHPQNQAPYDVLLSLVGAEQYQVRYGSPKIAFDTLGSVFPNLDLENVQQLYLQDDWDGMSSIAPRQAHFNLERKGDNFEGEAVFHYGERNPWPAEGIRKLSVPNSVMQDFFGQIKQLRVIESRYEPLMTHTDDYPDFQFFLQTNLGELEIFSSSHGENYAPWGIYIAGRVFVVNTGEPYRIFKLIEPYLQRKGEQETLDGYAPFKERKELPEPGQITKPSLLQEIYKKSNQINKTDATGIYSLAVSPNGKTVATGTDSNEIKLWDSEKGEISTTFKGENKYDTFAAVIFSPNGKYLAGLTRYNYESDSTIYIWDVASQKQIAKFNNFRGNVWSINFTPDSKTLVTSGSDRIIRLWEISSGKLKGSFKGQVPEFYEWYAVAVSPDGKTLAAAGSGDYKAREFPIKLWNLENGQELLTFKAHANSVRTLAFSPDGETLASAGRDQTIKFWNYRTGQLKQTLSVDTITVTGQKAAPPSPTSDLYFFNYRNDSGTTVLAFSPDGRRLASAHPAGYLRLWDVATGTELSVTAVQSETGNFYLAFAPDGKTLYSGHYNDGSLKKWQIIG